MNKLREVLAAPLSNICNDYTRMIQYCHAIEPPIPERDIKILLGFAGLLLSIATLGYFIDGYHFGFVSINNLTPYFPEFLLHNITVFGDGLFVLAITLLCFTRNIQLHWTILFAGLASGILANLLKDYFDFARPAGVLDPELFNMVGRVYKLRSFPSGHAITAFVMASVCFCYVKNCALKAALLFIAVLVGISRVLLGVHWPMDVLVGGALGVIIGAGAVIITLKWKAGIRVSVHLFTLALLITACLLIFIEGNDYQLALPLLYAVALAALIQAFRKYVLISIKRSSTIYAVVYIGALLFIYPTQPGSVIFRF